MSASFENGIFFEQAAWHREGVVSSGKLYAADVMEQVPEIASRVVKVPQSYPIRWDEDGYPPPDIRIDEMMVSNGTFATVRELDKQHLGTVGSVYEVVQNAQAFAFLDALVDSDAVQIETAISLRGGRTVIIVARRPENITIASEEHIPFLSFHNSFDGKSPLIMLATNVRIVCANTEAMALKEAPNRYTVRHTSKALTRLQEAREALEIGFKPSDLDSELAGLVKDEALRALKVSDGYTQAVINMGEALANTKINQRQFNEFTRKLIPVPSPKKNAEGKVVNAGSIEGAEDRIQELRVVYNHADNLNNIRGTKWGALQAVIQHQEHVHNYNSPDRKVESMLQNQNLVAPALEMLRR